MKYLIKRIQEADYGCEERPQGCGAMDLVSLRDEAGQEIQMEVPDADLLTQDINEGDWVYINSENMLYKQK